jgi:Uma2 family endonuclease
MPLLQKAIRYPTSDGRPLAETDLHFNIMVDSRRALEAYYENDPDVYVSGNLLMFYVPENKRRHVAPDVFVVKGVPKKQRENYLIWEEGKGPDVVIEITSKTTRKEDMVTKFNLYRDVIKVREYFLFDPRGDYLDPTLQGYRLSRGEYAPIAPVSDRLPSNVLGLYLEQNGRQLRFWDPQTREWLPTPQEARQHAESAVGRLEKSVREMRAELDALKKRIHAK